MNELSSIIIQTENSQLEFSFLFVSILVLIRLIGISIFLLFVFPNLLKETRINDNLKFLRWIVFIGLNVYTMAVIFNMFNTVCFFLGCLSQGISVVTAISQSFAVLLIYIILALIYNRKYRKKNK